MYWHSWLNKNYESNCASLITMPDHKKQTLLNTSGLPIIFWKTITMKFETVLPQSHLIEFFGLDFHSVSLDPPE